MAIAPSVSREKVLAVEFPAVELCREALLRPECIDFVAEGRRVEGGRRQAVLAAEGREFVLEWRAGDFGSTGFRK
jgi:hypothetical protein